MSRAILPAAPRRRVSGSTRPFQEAVGQPFGSKGQHPAGAAIILVSYIGISDTLVNPLNRPGRPPVARNLELVLEVLRSHDRATDGQIREELHRRGHQNFTRSMVNSRLRQLVERGLIDREHHVIQPRLFPAFLLLDVPRGRREQVLAALAEHPEPSEPVRVTGIHSEANLVVRTRVWDLRSIDDLRRRCLRAGAREARALFGEVAS